MKKAKPILIFCSGNWILCLGIVSSIILWAQSQKNYLWILMKFVLIVICCIAYAAHPNQNKSILDTYVIGFMCRNFRCQKMRKIKNKERHFLHKSNFSFVNGEIERKRETRQTFQLLSRSERENTKIGE